MSHPLHFRRCHVCHQTTTAQNQILRCSHCNKPLSPFFYFDEKKISPLTDIKLRPVTPNGEYGPVIGLTAYWDSY